MAHAGALARLRVERHHLAGGERRFDLEDPARTLRRRGKMLLHEIDPLHDDHAALGHDAYDLALLALVVAADHDDAVAFANARHHSTSGASETIFMNLRPRSSRATGPKMRVPIGSFWAFSMTALL